MVNIELTNFEARTFAELIKIRCEEYKKSLREFSLDLEDPLRISMQKKVVQYERLIKKLDDFGFGTEEKI